MNHRHHGHAVHHVRRSANHVAVPAPSPVAVVVDISPAPVLEMRAPLEPRTTCRPNDTSPQCEKPQKSNNAVFAAAAVVPIVIAIVVFFFLHRRHKKKLALEDINDKHKSLDFGMGESGAAAAKGKNGNKAPEMQDIGGPSSMKRGRGMSMDMDLSGPYMLPAALHGSRESFHSLSRSIKDSNDPYRPVAMGNAGDPYPPLRNENSSIYSASSNGTGRANLLKNAQPNPKSTPVRGESLRSESLRSEPVSLGSPVSSMPPYVKMSEPRMPPKVQIPEPAHSAESNFARKPIPQPSNNTFGLAPAPGTDSRDSYFDKQAKEMRSSNNYLGNFIHSRDPSADVNHTFASTAKRLPTPPQPPSQTSTPIQPVTSAQVSPLPKRISPPAINGLPARPGLGLQTNPSAGLPTSPRPPRLQSAQSPVHDPSTVTVQQNTAPIEQPGNTTSVASETSNYGDSFKMPPPPPPRIEVYEPQRRLSFDGPLPATQQPPQPQGLGVQGLGEENKRLSMSIRPLPVEDPSDNAEQRANRIRSFYKEYFDDRKAGPMPAPANRNYVDYHEDYGQEFTDGAVYDPSTGNFIFAQAPYAEPITRRAMTPPPRAPPRFRMPPQHGHGYSGSSGFLSPPGPRSGSPMSARSAPARKNLPPPQTLKSVPTPHMLKDDSAIFNAADFAPPPSFREIQNGRRPDSPMGLARPYSPNVSPHVPLQSAFQELSAVPSPYQLRNSRIFTALDFAPPPRIGRGDGGSDTASIRSNRSGISAVGLHSVRAGAYRVSRIPKEFVDTRDNMTASLKPRLNMITPA